MIKKSGDSIDKASQVIAFARFMDAIRDNKVEQKSTKSIVLIINDVQEQECPVLIARVSDYQGNVQDISI